MSLPRPSYCTTHYVSIVAGAGNPYPKALCGRTGLYSCRHRSVKTLASKTVSKISPSWLPRLRSPSDAATPERCNQAVCDNGTPGGIRCLGLRPSQSTPLREAANPALQGPEVRDINHTRKLDVLMVRPEGFGVLACGQASQLPCGKLRIPRCKAQKYVTSITRASWTC